jgi:site-specific DNA-methyltransferase (adenine-specific)
MKSKIRSKLNKTIVLSSEEQDNLSKRLVVLERLVNAADIANVTICQDMQEAVKYLPNGFVDLLFLDPPYNLTKTFNQRTFKQVSVSKYTDWLDGWLPKLVRLLKPTASVYLCGDWQSAASIQLALEKHFIIRNRITWEREKGRGAKSNWKNSSEDIWFATVSESYTFNIESVKLKRKVIAPYVDDNGTPKDWEQTSDGNFRLTHPSNIWTDLTVPFWSMAENTDHPTQKPEKLLAKIILASSKPGDFVLDPFLGSGTTSVVAKKLGRRFCGIEIDRYFCCLAEKRLELAETDSCIQGYADGVFWERNSGAARASSKNSIQSDTLAYSFRDVEKSQCQP